MAVKYMIPNEHLFALGNVVIAFSKLEHCFIKVFESLTKLDDKKIEIIMGALSFDDKFRIVRSLILELMRDKEKEEFKKILKAVDKARIDRNYLMHGLYEMSPDRGLAEISKSNSRMDLRFSKRGITSEEIIICAAHLNKATKDLCIFLGKVNILDATGPFLMELIMEEHRIKTEEHRIKIVMEELRNKF